MLIARVVKIYFVFAMSIVTAATLSYSPTISSYVLSVLHASGLDIEISETKEATAVANVLELQRRDIARGSFFYQGDVSDVNFDVNVDHGNVYARPNQKLVKMMNFSIKTAAEAAVFDGVKLAIVGPDTSILKDVYIDLGEEMVVGKIEKDYVVFDNLNVEIPEDSQVKLWMLLDLGENLKTGERFRFDLESAEDLALSVAGDSYKLKAYYPLKGNYLSVAKGRK